MDENPYASPRQTGSMATMLFWFMRAGCWVGVVMGLTVLAMDAYFLYTSGITLGWKTTGVVTLVTIWLLNGQAWCKRGV